MSTWVRIMGMPTIRLAPILSQSTIPFVGCPGTRSKKYRKMRKRPANTAIEETPYTSEMTRTNDYPG